MLSEPAEGSVHTGARAEVLANRIRPGEKRDLLGVATIQKACPEASQWEVAEYLGYNFLVSDAENRIAGFVVSRDLEAGEHEVLNLAVSPECRRQGVARGLMAALMAEDAGAIFLEVRESNLAAREFYKSIGFKEIGLRPRYYDTPNQASESAIVMKFHSC